MTETTITAFNWVPEFVRGYVRDHRVRWALEEIGRPYTTQLMNAMEERPEGYRQWQPFGQVPAFAEGGLKLFESGAILLYLGEQEESLLPASGQERWDAISWLFAAYASLEPPMARVVGYRKFYADRACAAEALEISMELTRKRFASLAGGLGDKDWLAGSFSIADIAMVTSLRMVDDTELFAEYPAIAAYVERGMARPAFRRAMESHMADFSETQAPA